MEDILSAECIAYANQKIRVRLTVIRLQLTNRQQQDKTNKNNRQLTICTWNFKRGLIKRELEIKLLKRYEQLTNLLKNINKTVGIFT